MFIQCIFVKSIFNRLTTKVAAFTTASELVHYHVLSSLIHRGCRPPLRRARGSNQPTPLLIHLEITIKTHNQNKLFTNHIQLLALRVIRPVATHLSRFSIEQHSDGDVVSSQEIKIRLKKPKDEILWPI